MTLSRIGVDGTLHKDSSTDGFGLTSVKAHREVLDLLTTLRTEADHPTISDKILKAYVSKHGEDLLNDDEEGHALGLQSGDESGVDD
jgi:hypothetical protein